MSGPIVVTKTGDGLVIACPYEALALVRTVPGRRWDAERKVWTAPAAALPACRQAFAGWPHGVLWDLEATPAPAGGDWAAGMFTGVPPRLHKRVHRALSGVLHPDAGGDHRAMQTLNDAFRDRKSA